MLCCCTRLSGLARYSYCRKYPPAIIINGRMVVSNSDFRRQKWRPFVHSAASHVLATLVSVTPQVIVANRAVSHAGIRLWRFMYVPAIYAVRVIRNSDNAKWSGTKVAVIT